MCGINGILSKNKSMDDIRLMNDLLKSRGPDSEGFFQDADTYLGHRRLKILDLSNNGKQPMEYKDLVIVFNGEIYNYLEIKSELIDKGHKFVSDSDTEVLLHLFSDMGSKCLDKLNGMFAFAIWNKRTKELFMARDRLGIKPLFYSTCENQMIFSSTFKAINSQVKFNLDHTSVQNFLLYGSVQEPRTLNTKIKSLEPGHYLTWKDGISEEKRYWNLKFSNNKYSVEKIRDLLESAVRFRLISDVPLGVFLSGGIDSSALALIANKFENIKTFSVAFNEKEYDESEIAQLVADEIGCEHNRILIKEEDIVEEFEAIISSMDQPSVDGFNTHIISQVVKKKGITVALSGLGSDEIFGGYPFFNSIPIINKISRYTGHMPFATSFGSRRAQKLQLMLMQGNCIGKLHQIQRMIMLPKQVEQVTSREVILDEPKSNNLSELEINSYLKNTLLHDSDRMGMNSSLEIRVPFLDHRLVEYLASIDSKYKLPGKKMLVDSVKEMPKEVYRRSKKGFVLPFDVWLKEGLKEYCETVFSKSTLNCDKTWNDFLKGKENASCVIALLVLCEFLIKQID